MSPISIHPTKRILDCVVSIAILTFFLPLIILFLVLIFLEHCISLRPLDPLFYSEIRWSEGKPFSLHKFNIFKQNVIENLRKHGETIYTKRLEHNGSLLYVGWILKQIYLDELPQLWNVLIGDMSVVGPRPVNTEVRAKLAEAGESDKDRIRAGITGYYQATRKVENSGGTQEELDHFYIEFCAHNPWYKILLFDIKIMFRTIKVLLFARGI